MNVRELFEMAIAELRQELPSFGKEVGERTLMARLAHHLASLVETESNNLKVDCEYNRVVDEIKMMPCAKGDDSGAEPTQRFFPDVILHCRRDKSQNLLVCEIKKQSTSITAEDDISRLKHFTKSAEFQYQLGAFLLINQSNKTISVQYFIGGEKVV